MQIVVANSKGGCGKTTLVLSLSYVLSSCQIVDLDPQATITASSLLTGKNIPVKPEEATAKYIVYDTPPYRMEELKSLFKNCDMVLVPVKMGYPDLLATRAIIEDFSKLKISNKLTIVFNKVRKPYNTNYRELLELFNQNYKDIKVAKSSLSNLLAYRRIMRDGLTGKAKEEVIALIEELNL